MFLGSDRRALTLRAEMLAATRSFFASREILEVDTHILGKAAPIDAHIDVMQVAMGGGLIGYLHTSPEYEMKKLLAKGSGDIYQLSHVFRAEEEGPLHSPEFTMVEWYRLGITLEEMIEECLDLIQLFCSDLPSETLSYQEAFKKYGKIDHLKDPLDDKLLSFSTEAPTWKREEKLDLLFSHIIEPQLGQDKLTVITEYPASQAALAKTATIDGTHVALRFEVYCQGIELANGYEELLDNRVQRERFQTENTKRLELGKEPLPIDEELLTLLDQIPPCCGVAVGFDRLMLLKERKSGIDSH